MRESEKGRMREIRQAKMKFGRGRGVRESEVARERGGSERMKLPETHQSKRGTPKQSCVRFLHVTTTKHSSHLRE